MSRNDKSLCQETKRIYVRKRQEFMSGTKIVFVRKEQEIMSGTKKLFMTGYDKSLSRETTRACVIETTKV